MSATGSIFFTLQEGIIERMSSPYEVIVKNLLKRESVVLPFINMKVTLSTGEVGVIEGSFGQSGKIKVRIIGSFLIHARLSSY